VRIFLAGASGVIGVRLIPLLTARGHVVAGMTRTAARADALAALGAEPVVCDVYDPGALDAAVAGFGPELVMHQLTDLPDDASLVATLGDRNDRIRTEGTANLIAAAARAGATRLLAQSIAWEQPPERAVRTRAFEQQVLDAGGVVLRYGQFHGPGTYFPHDVPPEPRVEIEEAARRTVELLDHPTGVVVVVDPVVPA
jgi:nucleoside-diphosphate-sugar epimerase